MTLAATKSITLPGSDDFFAVRDQISASLALRLRLLGSGPAANQSATAALDSQDWAPCPKLHDENATDKLLCRRQKSIGIDGWKEVLEFAIGNPVLVGYLAYILGLLIAIAVVKTAETGEGPIGRSHS